MATTVNTFWLNCDFFLYFKGLASDIEDQLADIFQVSNVVLLEDETVEKYEISVTKSKKYSCPRCRKIQSVSEDELCNRCSEVVNEMNENKKVVSA